MIYIRTDANATIATGHMMRCKTIAAKIKEAGGDVIFIVSDKESLGLLAQTDFEHIVLDSEWQNPDNDYEIKRMREILTDSINKDAKNVKNVNRKKPVLLIDSYSIKGSYTEKLADYASIAVIDDLFEEKFNADLIIDYNLYHYKFDYKKRYGDAQKLLLGGDYVPLRDEFLQDMTKRREFREKQLKNINQKTDMVESAEEYLNVLLICGGGDVNNILGGVVDKVIDKELNKKCRFHVVVGKYNDNRNELIEKSEKHNNICVYTNFVNMPDMMYECDLTVSAASTVLYECLAMQMPAIFFVAADNQQNDAECFSKDDLMFYAGDIIEQRKETLDNIVMYLNKILDNTDILKQMRIKGKETVDGDGARRIAEAVMKL